MKQTHTHKKKVVIERPSLTAPWEEKKKKRAAFLVELTKPPQAFSPAPTKWVLVVL